MNKINSLKLKSELRKVYRSKDNAFKTFEVKSENVNDYSMISQASACDILIDKMLTEKVKSDKLLKALIVFVNENNVIMKNIDNNKERIAARIKRHLTSDNIRRLEKRSIQLT